LIRAAGHKVRYQSSKEKKWKKALKKSCDIVVVAGGDGTVGKVSRYLIGSRTPIAILPLGTANNIARTLGITGKTLQELIKGWTKARCVNFDAGVAKGPWGSEHFIEGFGVGLVGEAIFEHVEKEKAAEGGSQKSTQIVDSPLRTVKEQLRRLQPRKMTVRLDGEDLSGDYFLLEAMNIRYIGPNLDLAPRAETNDGLLDVAFVTSKERRKLNAYIRSLLERKGTRPNLTIRRGRHLQIEWESSPVHIDDILWPEKDDEIPVKLNAIHVDVEHGALVFFIPKRTRRARQP
jgi:diacylglycerol kinase family enzyme